MICRFKGIHDCLVPVTPYLAGIFKHLRSTGKLPPRVRAMDMRHVLLILPFLLQGLLTEEVEEYNRMNPLVRIVDPSPMMLEISIMLLSWYRLYRRKFPAKDEDDIKDLSSLGQRSIFLLIKHMQHKIAYFVDILHIMRLYVFMFLQRCKELFPYTNKKGNSIVETEKMHSIKHVPNDILRYGNTENLNVEGPENLHKEWVKGQGGKTNQGPTSHKTMMMHSLRKEASALLSEAVQGQINAYLCLFDELLHICYVCAYIAYFS